MSDEDIAAIRHKLWVYGTEDSLAALGVIRQIEAERDRLREENFKLAANQCADGYGDEYGNHRCRKVDAAEAERDRLRDALTFYANPEVYKPHPHGLGFDDRDLSYVAVAALKGDTQ